MTLKELKDKCLALLAKNDFEEVLRLLCVSFDPERKAFQILISISSRYNQVLAEEMKGVVSFDNATLVKNQIASSLGKLLKDLETGDLGKGGALEDPLNELARELMVDFPLSPLFLVNCDRKKPSSFFWKAFRAYLNEHRHFQFYFLPSCPTQEPEDFAERIVYELLEKESENERQSVDFRRRADGRLCIEPLPASNVDTQECKKEFRKYFAGRFGLAHSEESFESYLNTGLPKLPWNYVAMAFRTTAAEWDQEIMEEYLDWLIEKFRETGPNIPNFIFFFVVIVKKAHRPDKVRRDDLEALEGVESIVAAHTAQATLIAPLPPVPTDDLEYWVDRLGNVTTDQKNRLIRLIAEKLEQYPEEEEQFRDRRELNMERIKDYQEKVYRHHK